MIWRRSARCDTASCIEVKGPFQTSQGDQMVEKCIEVGAGFRKASRCESWTCVEVGRPAGVGVMIRDSKEPDTAPMLAVSAQAWAAFLSHVGAVDA